MHSTNNTQNLPMRSWKQLPRQLLPLQQPWKRGAQWRPYIFDNNINGKYTGRIRKIFSVSAYCWQWKSAKIFQNQAKLKNTNNRKNPVVFGACPSLNVLAPGISMASAQNSQRLKKYGCCENLNILRLKDARKTHFCTFSMIWATFCTHLNHCYNIMYFSLASPKVLTLSKIWRGRCTLLAWLPKWEEHLDRLECEQLQLLTGEKGRKFETSSAKDTWVIRERIGQHLRG